MTTDTQRQLSAFWKWLKSLVFRCNDCIDVCCYDRTCFWYSFDQKFWGK